MPVLRTGLRASLIAALLAMLVVPSVAFAAGRKVTLKGPRQVRAQALLTLTGRVSKAKSVPVVIQKAVRHGWAPLVHGHTDKHGRFALTVGAPAKAGRLVIRADVAKRRATSKSLTIKILALPKGVKRVVVSSKTEVVAPSDVTSAPAPGHAGRLTLSGSDDVSVGQILAIAHGNATPFGFLGRVTGVVSKNGQTVATTVPATLEEAVPQGSLNATMQSPTFTGAAARSAQPTLQPSAKPFERGADTTANNFSCSDGASGAISSSLSMNFGLKLNSDWSLNPFNFGLQSTSVVATASASASAEASVNASATCNLPDIQFFRYPQGKCYSFGICTGWSQMFWVGPVPVYLTEYVTGAVGGSASASAALDTSAHASFSASAGISWDHNTGFHPIGSFNSHFGFKPPTLSGKASVGAHITGTIHVLIYGVAGPQINLQPGLSLSADTTANPWWKLSAPVKVTAGVSIPALKLSSPTLTVYQHTFRIADAGGPFSGGPGAASVSVTNPGSQTGTVGTAVNLQINATDTDGGALVYSARGLPTGLSINSSTGLITGTPTDSTDNTVTITATDTSGPTGTTTFSWDIAPLQGNGAYQQTVLADNPAGFWPLDDAAGPAARDLSTADDPGTYATSGVTYHNPGPFPSSNAITADGSATAMTADVPSMISATARSEEVWLRTTAGFAGGNTGTDIEGSGIIQVGRDAIWLNNGGGYGWSGNGTAFGASQPYPLNDGSWHQLVVTYDGTNAVTFYVDGQPVATTNNTGQLPIGGAQVQIDFPGSYGDLAVYPTALTGQQVREQWAAGRSGEGCGSPPSTALANAILGDGAAVYMPLNDVESSGGGPAADVSQNCAAGQYSPDAQSDPSGITADPTVPVADQPTSPTQPLVTLDAPAVVNMTARSEEVWLRTTAGFAGGNTGTDIEGSGIIQVGRDAIWLNNGGGYGWSGNGTAFGASQPYPLNDGSWHQLVVTYDGTNAVTFYVDGQPVATTNNTGQLPIGGAQVQIDFPGSYGDLAVYPTALTAQQVQNHWAAGH